MKGQVACSKALVSRTRAWIKQQHDCGYACVEEAAGVMKAWGYPVLLRQALCFAGSAELTQPSPNAEFCGQLMSGDFVDS